MHSIDGIQKNPLQVRCCIGPQRTGHARGRQCLEQVQAAELTAAGQPFGLRLPPDPSSGAFATSGGMVSTNAAGPRSVRSGSVRNWVEAIEIIGADGEARRINRGEAR